MDDGRKQLVNKAWLMLPIMGDVIKMVHLVSKSRKKILPVLIVNLGCQTT